MKRARRIEPTECYESPDRPGYAACVVVMPFKMGDMAALVTAAKVHAELPTTWAGGRVVTRATGTARIERFAVPYREVLFVALETAKNDGGADAALDAMETAIWELVKAHDQAGILRGPVYIVRPSGQRLAAIHVCIGQVRDDDGGGNGAGDGDGDVGGLGDGFLKRFGRGFPGSNGSSANN